MCALLPSEIGAPERSLIVLLQSDNVSKPSLCNLQFLSASFHFSFFWWGGGSGVVEQGLGRLLVITSSLTLILAAVLVHCFPISSRLVNKVTNLLKDHEN